MMGDILCDANEGSERTTTAEIRLHGSTLSSSDYIKHDAYLIHRSIIESLNKQPSEQAIQLKNKTWYENCDADADADADAAADADADAER